MDNSKAEAISQQIPRGRPKSGRLWKSVKLQRVHSDFAVHAKIATEIVRRGHTILLEADEDKPLKTSWEKKEKLRLERKLTKAYERALKDNRAKELEDKRKRREEQQQRKLENERKAEVVQKISNTAKLKKMRKKQLRKVEKR